ncbi:MAG: hypothetical protein H7Y27_10040 [Gemmatimonadaceae bacterium]|nr:hypothetical protein [Chitinophagaceae bacterium]
MKRTIILFSMLLIIGAASGQARETTVENTAAKQEAAMIEVPYSPDMVTAAMNDYLTKKGRSKGTNIKGYTAYRNQNQASADSVNADLYFKVERKSRSEKETSIVTLLLNTPAVSTAPNTAFLNMEQAKQYLNDLTPAIAAYGLEQEIKDLTESVSKAESKLKSLKNDADDLEKKRSSLENKMKENREDQEKQQAEVEKQRLKLAMVTGQRKG